MVNDGLRLRQQKIREHSIEQITWAVQYLRDLEGEHCRLTAAKLADLAGLSRAVLYKAHLRAIWDTSWAESEAQRRKNSQEQAREKEKRDLEMLLSQLQKRLEKSERQNIKLMQELEIEKARSTVYKKDYEELKQRHQKLLHHNLRVLRRLHTTGLDISDLTDSID